jgi:hypothetical protein
MWVLHHMRRDTKVFRMRVRVSSKRHKFYSEGSGGKKPCREDVANEVSFTCASEVSQSILCDAIMKRVFRCVCEQKAHMNQIRSEQRAKV